MWRIQRSEGRSQKTDDRRQWGRIEDDGLLAMD